MDLSTIAGAVSPSGGGGVASTHAGYGFSLTDVSRFQEAMGKAAQSVPCCAPTVAATQATDVSQALKLAMRPIEQIDRRATELGVQADALRASGVEMSPGDLLMLTMRAQEFMFHCQLTSNVAGRASDGLQQLMRQQS